MQTRISTTPDQQTTSYHRNTDTNQPAKLQGHTVEVQNDNKRYIEYNNGEIPNDCTHFSIHHNVNLQRYDGTIKVTDIDANLKENNDSIKKRYQSEGKLLFASNLKELLKVTPNDTKELNKLLSNYSPLFLDTKASFNRCNGYDKLNIFHCSKIRFHSPVGSATENISSDYWQADDRLSKSTTTDEKYFLRLFITKLITGLIKLTDDIDINKEHKLSLQYVRHSNKLSSPLIFHQDYFIDHYKDQGTVETYPKYLLFIEVNNSAASKDSRLLIGHGLSAWNIPANIDVPDINIHRLSGDVFHHIISLPDQAGSGYFVDQKHLTQRFICGRNSPMLTFHANNGWTSSGKDPVVRETIILRIYPTEDSNSMKLEVSQHLDPTYYPCGLKPLHKDAGKAQVSEYHALVERFSNAIATDDIVYLKALMAISLSQDKSACSELVLRGGQRLKVLIENEKDNEAKTLYTACCNNTLPNYSIPFLINDETLYETKLRFDPITKLPRLIFENVIGINCSTKPEDTNKLKAIMPKTYILEKIFIKDIPNPSTTG
nr:hypothetical protein [Endozoicomonas sp.]